MSRKKQDKDPGPLKINKVQSFSLMLYNDDFHTHDYVIDALVKVCGHDVIQATQCTFLAHFKKKCEIKRGPKYLLIPMQKALIKLELRALIN